MWDPTQRSVEYDQVGRMGSHSRHCIKQYHCYFHFHFIPIVWGYLYQVSRTSISSIWWDYPMMDFLDSWIENWFIKWHPRIVDKDLIKSMQTQKPTLRIGGHTFRAPKCLMKVHSVGLRFNVGLSNTMHGNFKCYMYPQHVGRIPCSQHLPSRRVQTLIPT